MSDNLAALKKSREMSGLHKNGKKQAKVREFRSTGMNAAETSFNAVSILFHETIFITFSVLFI